jgi:hypothetical protein
MITALIRVCPMICENDNALTIKKPHRKNRENSNAGTVWQHWDRRWVSGEKPFVPYTVRPRPEVPENPELDKSSIGAWAF